MKRIYFVCCFSFLGTTFLLSQLHVPASGQRAVPLAKRVATPPSPGMSYKSPVMQRLWAVKQHQLVTTTSEPSGQQTSPFLTTPPMYAAGSGAFDIALGDFNSDGNQDVIVAANPPVLLLGNGNGTLQGAVPIGAIASEPTGVAVADFNRDGNLDVVFAISGGAIVYLGNGNGIFGAGTTFSSGGTNKNVFARVLAADANGDGIPDLILNTDAGVSVLLGNGDGTFQAPITSPGTVQFMSAADFNKDGRVDLAVTNGYNTLSIMLGNGAGTFTVASTYTVGTGNFIAIADYNRDGFPDVALPGNVFLGNGDGTLRAPIAFPTVPGATVVAAADVNGDGIPDLLTAYGDGDCGTSDFGTMGVSLGNGDGTFQPVTVFDSGGCNSRPFMAVGDLNNDGAPDVVVLSGGGESFSSTPELIVLINRRSGTFPAAELNISGGSGGVAVSDFNRDGNADVVLADGSVYLGGGDGKLHFLASASLGGVAVTTGDFNHDGNPDLAAAVECVLGGCSSGGQLSIASGNGDGTFQTPTALPSGGFYAESLVVADFNGDGNLDIALVNNCTDSGCSTGGSVSIYLGNNNGTFSFLNTITNISGFPTSIVAGDFNNDGRVDLAVSGIAAGSDFNPPPVNVLLGNGDGSFQSPIVFAASGCAGGCGISAAVIGDFNSDGILDLVLADGAQACADCEGHGTIMYGNGDGTFTAGPVIGTEGGPPISVVAADFLGTGALTPVLANRCGDSLDCPFGSVMIDGTPNQTDIMLQFLGVGDFNNDGKPDLVGSLQYDAGASVLLNVGSAAAATTTTISPSAPQSLSVFQKVTFTAQVQHTGPGAPTGQIEFLDNGVLIGTASVASNGQASIAPTSLTVGSHFVVAYYEGDSSFATSNSLGVRVTVINTNTAVALTSSVNPSISGKTITFTATVSSSEGTPAGKVTFLDGTTVLATKLLSGGTTILTDSGLSPGLHSITAVYGGNPSFDSSASAPVSQRILAATTTKLTSSGSPSYYGRLVYLTALVSSSVGGPPNGETISFFDDGGLLATVALSGGSATFESSTLMVGPNRVVAVYGGDTTRGGSTSNAVVEDEQKGTTAIYLVSSQNPSPFGQAVTFTASVSARVNATPPDGENVTFMEGATVLGSGTLTGGSTSFTTSELPLGSHHVQAVYAGDSDFDGSHSNTVNQVVDKYPTTTALASALNPSTYGQQVIFTATVASTGPNAPTGSVNFGGLGNAPLIEGVAALTKTWLNAGTYTITAEYAGDSYSAPSASSALNQVVNPAPTTTAIASSADPSSSGQTVTFTATVTSSTGAHATGTVTFTAGITILGTVELSGIHASISTTRLSVGSTTIAATYNGATDYTGSSASLVQTVN